MELLPSPVLELLSVPGVQDGLEEAGRIFFSNQNLTINLLPALLVGALALLGEREAFNVLKENWPYYLFIKIYIDGSSLSFEISWFPSVST